MLNGGIAAEVCLDGGRVAGAEGSISIDDHQLIVTADLSYHLY